MSRQAMLDNGVRPVHPGSSGDVSAGSRFSAAKILARKRRYPDAVRQLQLAVQAFECSEAQALDLQARIYAQQGLNLFAESCWRKARELDSTNPAYDEGLARLRRPSRLTAGPLPIACALGAMTVLALVLWQSTIQAPRMVDRLEANAASLHGLDSGLTAFEHLTMTGLEGLRRGLKTLEGDVGDSLDRLPTHDDAARRHDSLVVRIEGELASRQQTLLKSVQRSREDWARMMSEADARIAALMTATEIQGGLIRDHAAAVGQSFARSTQAQQAAVTQQGELVATATADLGARLGRLQSDVTEHHDLRADSIEKALAALTDNASITALEHDVASLRQSTAAIEASLLQIIEEIRLPPPSLPGEHP